MTKKTSHSDVVGLHVFFYAVMTLLSLGLLIFGLFGATRLAPLGLANAGWCWMLAASGALGFVGFPVKGIGRWPTEEDEETV